MYTWIKNAECINNRIKTKYKRLLNKFTKDLEAVLSLQ